MRWFAKMAFVLQNKFDFSMYCVKVKKLRFWVGKTNKNVIYLSILVHTFIRQRVNNYCFIFMIRQYPCQKNTKKVTHSHNCAIKFVPTQQTINLIPQHLFESPRDYLPKKDELFYLLSEDDHLVKYVLKPSWQEDKTVLCSLWRWSFGECKKCWGDYSVVGYVENNIIVFVTPKFQ